MAIARDSNGYTWYYVTASWVPYHKNTTWYVRDTVIPLSGTAGAENHSESGRTSAAPISGGRRGENVSSKKSIETTVVCLSMAGRSITRTTPGDEPGGEEQDDNIHEDI